MSSNITPIDRVQTSQSHCQTCSLSSLCLPESLQDDEVARLDGIVSKGRPLHKGDSLFKQGDPFRSLFVIRAGSLKTFTLTHEGDEQINGFYFPGELVGLAGIDDGFYPMSAMILETTSLCEIPYERLDELTGQLPELRRSVIRSLGREIRDDQQMLMLLSRKTAEQRVATFLLKLSSRYKARGYSPTQFRLSMSRNEIGNYLGLAVETISRIFTRFGAANIIHAEGKSLDILDLHALHQASGDDHIEGCIHHVNLG
jgi:CRP/FNR family transcriptional regulator, anaerobic regulatory protein